MPDGVIFHELFDSNRVAGTVHVDSLLPSVYSLQVKGVGAAAGAWTCTLEGSQDGENWWVIITHNSGTYSDGTPAFVRDGILRPYCKLRVQMADIVLGSATGIRAIAVATTA